MLFDPCLSYHFLHLFSWHFVLPIFSSLCLHWPLESYMYCFYNWECLLSHVMVPFHVLALPAWDYGNLFACWYNCYCQSAFSSPLWCLPFCLLGAGSSDIAQLWWVSSSHACCSWWSTIQSWSHEFCMICCCSYSHICQLLFHGSMVHPPLIEPLKSAL